ncbi:MAG TPA: amidohydrolase family protein [Acidimicrobiales bacterium]|jgi:predicted TIM-barrel fold metal-dependent hydrolase|nr:amidohydrolase family protein [Acidimicrobiales bacterium]
MAARTPTHPIFDADNHYYEGLDAFTRHLPAGAGPRTVEWAEVNGRKYHLLAGKICRAVTNPTFDPVAKPGILADYFRGNPNGANPLERLKEREPVRDAYRTAAARLPVLEEHGLEAAWIFPTLGMIYEEHLKHDPGAVAITFEAFNRWLLDDWGYNHDDRLFAAPYLSLADPGWACRELEFALDHGARTVVMRPAAPTTVDGPKPPADTAFDPFWARVNEAGITVVVHAGDSGYTSHGYADDGFSANFAGGGVPRPIKMLNLERPIEDFLASLVGDQLFARFPNVRIASVENGSGFLRSLLHRLQIVSKKMPGWFQEDPAVTFRRHIWINPFWEDDIDEVVELMGADRVLFGSDWPHIEALPHPLDYLEEVAHLDEASRRKILHDNVAELNDLRPA